MRFTPNAPRTWLALCAPWRTLISSLSAPLHLRARLSSHLCRASFKYFGKLRATSVLGNEFVVYDRGDAPGVGGVGGVGKQGARAPGALSLGGAGGRQELAAVRYETNVLGLKGPRKMTGVVPALSPSGQRLYRPEGEGDSMLKR